MKKTLFALALLFPALVSARTLSYGMSGNDVLALQKTLDSIGCLRSSPTGYFGRETVKAMTCYSRSGSKIISTTSGAPVQATLDSAGRSAQIQALEDKITDLTSSMAVWNNMLKDLTNKPYFNAIYGIVSTQADINADDLLRRTLKAHIDPIQAQIDDLNRQISSLYKQ